MADEPQADSAGVPDLKFAHYRVLRRPDGSIWELGRGAMGVTYKAYDERLRIDVALKVIAPGQVDDVKTQALFLREARAAARVHQSNVASVVHLNDTPGNFFYAMEFIAGESLADWLKTRGALPPAMATGLAMQIASGLGAIHAQQIVHRDLKPANLMIVAAGRDKARGDSDSNPDAWQIKIIDFGLARGFGGEGLGTAVDAKTIGFRGTALYASPEQCEEHGQIDGRSDLYSLGCILWEMLVGAPPFRGSSLHELLTLHVSRPAPVTQLARLPASLQAVVARLLVKDPDGRFANAAALVKALERCRTRIENGAEPADAPGPASELETAVDARPETSRPPVTAPPSRQVTGPRILLGVAALAVLLFFGGLVSGWWRHPPANADKATAAAGPAPSRKSIAVLPFENRSSDKENDYLAEGLHEDILTALAGLQDLRVVARDSVQAFKPGAGRNLGEIAKELGVGSVLEGSVRRSDNRVRVTAQLIDPATKQSIWGNSYDRDVTDVLEIQTQISQDIAKALLAKLSPAESKQLARPPTNNPAAYDEYVRGRAREGGRPIRADNKKATAHLERAVELDPEFALAYADLVYLRAYSYGVGWDRSEASVARVRSELQIAKRLQPELPQVAEAEANYLFRVENNYEEALRVARLAEQRSPNHPAILVTIGNILRRTGRLEEAVSYLRRAEALSPREARVLDLEGRSYDALRQFDELERVLLRKMVVLPDWDTEVGLALARAKKNNDWSGYVRELQRLDPRLDDEARVGFRMQARDFAGALQALQQVKGDWIAGEPRLQVAADIQASLGDRAAADAASLEFEAWARKRLAEIPSPTSKEDEQRIRNRKAKLAIACAMVGKKEAAVRLAKELLSTATDEMEPEDRYGLYLGVADVFGRAGDMSRAISIYRNLLEVPSGLTRFELRNDPGFEEFRKDPSFAAMVAEPGP